MGRLTHSDFGSRSQSARLGGGRTAAGLATSLLLASTAASAQNTNGAPATDSTATSQATPPNTEANTAANTAANTEAIDLDNTATTPVATGPLPRVVTNSDNEVVRRSYWAYRFFSALRLNPLGFFLDARASYRSRIHQSVDTLFREAYVAITPAVAVTPAWVRTGAVAEFQPLAIINLSAGYDYIAQYGTFDTIQSWNSPQARASDRNQDLGTPSKWTYAATGHQLTFGAIFQLRVAGSIVLRSNAKLFYYAMNTRVPEGTAAPDPAVAGTNVADRRGDRVWYDITYDLLTPARGWATHIDSDILFSPEGAGLTVGLRHSYTQAFFQQTDFASGDLCAAGRMGTGMMSGQCLEYTEPNGAMHRLGPIFAYNFREAAHSRFNAPTLFISLQWWLAHRYRLGGPGPTELLVNPNQSPADYIAAGIPYFAIGFTFRGDLLYPRR